MINVVDYNMYTPVKKVVYDKPKTKKKRKVSSSNSLDNIINLIYRPDEISRLPTGDLSKFLNSETSEELKSFIKRELMTENSYDMVPQDKCDSISDDLMIELLPRKGETREDFGERVDNMLSQWREERKRKQDEENDKKLAYEL